MNNVIIQEVRTRSDLKEFIHLPAKLHKNHANWVPPIYKDEWHYFNPGRNKAFSYCDTVLLLARGNGITVGRIMGIINHHFNESKSEKTARFSFLDCINDIMVSGRLLDFVEKWAHAKGMEKIIGPFGMYYHDPIGFMIEGFKERPSLTANYNFEYIIPLLQSSGYKRETDLVVYKLDLSKNIPEVYAQVYNKMLQNPKVRLLIFKTRKELRGYIHPVLRLMNESFKEIYGYSQLDENEMTDLANHFIPILDPKLVAVVTWEDEVAGFMISVPSINDGIIKSRGHLFPTGFLQILKASRNARELDLLIGGIKSKYRGLGIDALIAVHTINIARKAGYRYIDSHLELETNWKMRAENENLGGIVYKKYRIFQKNLIT